MLSNGISAPTKDETIIKDRQEDRNRTERLAAYLCQLALVLVGFAMLGLPGGTLPRSDGGPEAVKLRHTSLLLVDRHDDHQRFAHPLDKRVQKSWRGTQSDPFLPAEISDLHPADRFVVRAVHRPQSALSRTSTGFLARAPPHLIT